MAETTVSREVTAATFDAEVVEASHEQAVVVDFWAPWCGPCHQLSPVLEQVAARHVDDVRTVKLNVDEAPAIAQRYRVQGIPAIKALRDGAVVAELTGVQSEQALERLYVSLAPSEADRRYQEAIAASDGQREQLLRAALAADPGHERSAVALAELLVERGEADEARQLLQRVEGSSEAQRLLAQLRLQDGSVAEDELGALSEQAAAGDATAQLRLGRAHAAAGRYEDALEMLLPAVAQPAVRDPAREAVLEIFRLLGDEHELVRAYRPRLAAALF